MSDPRTEPTRTPPASNVLGSAHEVEPEELSEGDLAGDVVAEAAFVSLGDRRVLKEPATRLGGLEISVTADPAVARVGDVVSIAAEVANVSDVPFEHVTVTDDEEDLGVARLGRGERTSFERLVLVTDEHARAGSVVRTVIAEASGTDAELVRRAAVATVEVLAPAQLRGAAWVDASDEIAYRDDGGIGVLGTLALLVAMSLLLALAGGWFVGRMGTRQRLRGE